MALYLTLFGVVAGLVSTFWTFGYTRLARRLRGYSLGGARGALRRVRKRDVLATLERGCWINVLGMAATLLGLQATVGLLVAKTLTNATANPFLAGGAGSYNPVLALDVFLVQVGPWRAGGSCFCSLVECSQLRPRCMRSFVDRHVHAQQQGSPEEALALRRRPPTRCCRTLWRCWATCGWPGSYQPTRRPGRGPMARRPRRRPCPSPAAEPQHAFVHSMLLLLLICGVRISGCPRICHSIACFPHPAVCKETHDLDH